MTYANFNAKSGNFERKKVMPEERRIMLADKPEGSGGGGDNLDDYLIFIPFENNVIDTLANLSFDVLGTSVFEQGKFGRSVSTLGYADGIYRINSSVSNYFRDHVGKGDGDFSIDFWGLTTAGTSSTTIILSSSLMGDFLHIDGKGGTLEIETMYGDYSNGFTFRDFNDGGWHHFAYQFLNNNKETYELECFLDGTKYSSKSGFTLASALSGDNMNLTITVDMFRLDQFRMMKGVYFYEGMNFENIAYTYPD